MDMREWTAGAVARAAAAVHAAAESGRPGVRRPPAGTTSEAHAADALEQARLRRLERQVRRAQRR